jgi:hypothetical protein
MPFGGMTLILSGDLGQVPVVTKNSTDFLQAEAMFCSMERFNGFKHLPLHQIMRQDPNEIDFCKILDEIRSFEPGKNGLCPDSIDLLKTRVIQLEPSSDFSEVRKFLGLEGLAIFYKNQHIDEYNQLVGKYYCSELKSALHTSFAVYLIAAPGSYLAGTTRGPMIHQVGLDRTIATGQQRAYYLHAKQRHETSCLVQDSFTFFQGARIMLLKNIDQDMKMVNGRRGTISEVMISDTHRKQPDALSVDFDPISGETEPTKYVVFKQAVDSLKFPDGRTITMYQFPLKLAYGVIAHKAQSQILPKVAIDIEHPAFVHGALYVALSRVRTLSDLILFSRNEFPPNGPEFHLNPYIAEIEQDLDEDPDQAFGF